MSTPYYQDEAVTLYHGDCREVTAWLDADALVFDPPYGRAWRQGEIKGKRASAPRDGIANDTTTEVRDTILAMWGDRPSIAFGDLMLAPPAGTRLVGIYKKPSDAGVRGAIAGLRRDAEAIYFIGPWPAGMGGRSSVFETRADTVGNPSGLAARYGHSHAKPEDVMWHLLIGTTGTIADPTAGGGSTLATAKRMGRKAIGVEIDEGLCERIARRLSQDILDFGEASA